MCVSRQTVMRWERLRQQGGLESLRRAEHFGRPRLLSGSLREELVRLLKAGSLAGGFATVLWTRIARLIEDSSSVSMVPSSVWRLRARHGTSVQRPSGQARERDALEIRAWEAKRSPALQKSLREKGE